MDSKNIRDEKKSIGFQSVLDLYYGPSTVPNMHNALCMSTHTSTHFPLITHAMQLMVSSTVQ